MFYICQMKKKIKEFDSTSYPPYESLGGVYFNYETKRFKERELVDEETAEVKRYKEKFDVMPYGDNASFAKLFKGNYSVLKMLSSVGFNFFFYMVEFLLTSNHYFIYVDVDKVAKEMGYKTRKSVYDALIELLNYDILRKKTGEGFFWVNPNVVFRGDRTYVLNKNIEGFENVKKNVLKLKLAPLNANEMYDTKN